MANLVSLLSVILFSSSYSVSANDQSDKTELLLSLIDHYQIKNCILVGDYVGFQLLKRLSKMSVFTARSPTCWNDLRRMLVIPMVRDNPKYTLVVFLTPSTAKVAYVLRKMSFYSDLFRVGSITWVWFFDTEEEFFRTDYRNIRFGYNCEFLGIYPKNGNSTVYQIDEVYKKLPYLEYPTRLQYGFWSKEKGLEVSVEEFYKRRIDLNGITMLVLDNGDCKIAANKASCFISEIWKDFEDRMNFTSERHTLDNLVDDQEKYAQSIIGPSQIFNDIFSGPNFVGPIFYLNINMFIKYQRVQITGLGSFFVPFSRNVWICFSVYVFLFFTVRLLLELSQKKQNLSQNFHISDCIFLVITILANQEFFSDSQGLISSSTHLIGRFANIVIFSAYSGAIVSILASDIPFLPFRTFQEFADNGQYLLNVNQGTYLEEYFENETLEKITDELKVPKNLQSEQGAILCTHDKIVVVGLDTDVYELAHCDIQKIPLLVYNKATIGMYLHEKSCFTEIFGRIFNRLLYAGIVKRKKDDIVIKAPYKEAKFYNAFEIWQLFPVWSLMCLGIVISPLVLYFETCLAKRGRKKCS